jgi:hypothetical protein
VGKATHVQCLDFATVVADSLQDLLDFVHEAIVEDWGGQLDHTKVTGTFGHVLFTCTASEVAVDCSEMRIVRTFLSRSEALLIPALEKVRKLMMGRSAVVAFIVYIHRLRIFDVNDSQALALFGREEAKLNFLDGAQRRARIREIETRHGGAWLSLSRVSL